MIIESAKESTKKTASTFPLRLMPNIRVHAEKYSRQEGVSLNQFINVAVAEKIAEFRQEEWLRNRRQPNDEILAEALAILDRNRDRPVEPGDELPDGYTSSVRDEPQLTTR